jgi:hypothetical protein
LKQLSSCTSVAPSAVLLHERGWVARR